MNQRQNVMHLKLHHKQNNMLAIVSFIAALIYALYHLAMANKAKAAPVEGSTCKCDTEISMNSYYLGLYSMLVILILWVMNMIVINKTRNTVIAQTVDEYNSKN